MLADAVEQVENTTGISRTVATIWVQYSMSATQRTLHSAQIQYEGTHDEKTAIQ